MDTLCITYLSTYLVPIPAPPGLSSSGFLTFSGNRSTTTASETTPIADLSSDVAPTAAQTDTETPSNALITGSLTEPIDTTSAFPTATGIVEPPGRAVIFLIQEANDNQKRDISKRATGGFVGADNPDICIFALIFNLAEAFGVQGDEALPQGAVTRAFATSGRTLVFRNSDLPNGEAGFCQDASGKAYITFTTSPSGCIPITLGVYDVEQCQNGRLVGVETSSSSMAVSSEATTVETDSSGSDSIGESTAAATTESTGSNPFSSTGSSNTPSETDSGISTTSTSEIIESSFASTSEESTEVAVTSSDISISESSKSASSAVSSTAEEVISTTTTAVSESSIEIIASTKEASTTSSEPVETSISLIRTSGSSSSETSTAEETTTSLSSVEVTESSTEATIPDTTTELTMTTTTAAAPNSCRALSDPYTDSGVTFDLSCDSRVSTGISIGNRPANSFQQCVFFCATTPSCAAISFTKSSRNCQGFSSFDGTVADNLFDVAIKQVISTTAAEAPTTTAEEVPTTTAEEAPTTTDALAATSAVPI
ncbi:hypothetical protein FIE12Z_1218 [Fusarium flagelliforme]|uniref:DUF7908 domain-containing protein n=1 Tax=Fusarium flagelliforme TaxID=2675880 RepID=A0A395N3B2_9HYPO|nr:hypothetical protein FIE12Z_1218 [Fusarium flagelliforme]